jgi:MFS family permease
MLSAGTGAFTSVDLAMATDLLPEKDKAGKYMSIYYLSSGLPGVIAPIVAPAIILIGGDGNYPALFVAGAILALGASISTWRIRGVR